jgi:hypothetical protein
MICDRAATLAYDIGCTTREPSDEVQAKLKNTLSLPTGYFLDVGGKVEGQKRAARSLTNRDLRIVARSLSVALSGARLDDGFLSDLGYASRGVCGKHCCAAFVRRDLEWFPRWWD